MGQKLESTDHFRAQGACLEINQDTPKEKDLSQRVMTSRMSTKLFYIVVSGSVVQAPCRDRSITKKGGLAL